MFKRANKITSLLVAAAAVVSLAPTAAFAADVKKIDAEDGVIYGAVAYKDGAALIDGEVEDNDAAYYFADGKYTELEDVDSGSDYFAYGDKFVKVNSDGDYFVDLTNGTVTDDSVDEDDEDDAASALRKEIKGSDRYSDTSSTTAPFGDADVADITLLPGNKFGDSWYSAEYRLDVPGTYATNAKAGSLTNHTDIYTDSKGNYIDADYNLGKIKVETTYGSATIENSVDTEDIDVNSASDKQSADAKVQNTIVLGQDKDYIYRYAEIVITVPGATGTVKVNNKPFTTTQLAAGLPVIQKISKAQDTGDIDDGKFAKTVYNYVISDDGADMTGGDATDYLALASNTSTSVPTKAAVINGKLALYTIDNSTTNADNVKVQTATLKQKNGYYYTDLESKTTIQAEYSEDLDKIAADTDVDGNIYVIDGGYVKEFDGTDDWNKVYKVDGSFDALSVYDKDNMVAWSQGDEVYSIIGAKKATDDTTVPTTPVVTAGWVQANGTWTYNKADGTKATGWLNDGGAWYFLKADGTMATGWVQDGSTWYHLNASGAMQTGWLNDNGTWYYLNASGAMLANTTVDGYVLGASGAWVK